MSVKDCNREGRMKLHEVMEEYIEINKCFIGNDYWSKKFEDAYNEDMKTNFAQPEVKQVACGSEHKFNNELHEMHPCIIHLAEIDGETKFVKASEWENGSKYFREDFAKWKFNSKPSV